MITAPVLGPNWPIWRHVVARTRVFMHLLFCSPVTAGMRLCLEAHLLWEDGWLQ